MQTRRNFIRGLFGLAGGILASAGIKVHGGTKRPNLKYNRYSTVGTRAAIAAAGRCEPSLGQKYQDDYILVPETGLPELSEKNLNIMLDHQEQDSDAVKL